jgi:SH3 domain protein
MSAPVALRAPATRRRAMASHALRGALLSGALLAAQAAAAQTLYVGDRLQIGVHEAPSAASTIFVLIASGAALEVLERNEQMVRVRTEDGAEGWVDLRYLSEQAPGRTRVPALESQLAGAQAALAEAQAKVVALEQRSTAAPDPAAAAAAQTIPSDTLRELQSLAEENQRLKQQLAELEAVQRMALERQQAAPAHASDDAAAMTANALATHAPLPPGGRWEDWHLILVASVLLLAFAAGGWLVDWGIRRRHGGFRV